MQVKHTYKESVQTFSAANLTKRGSWILLRECIKLGRWAVIFMITAQLGQRWFDRNCGRAEDNLTSVLRITIKIDCYG